MKHLLRKAWMIGAMLLIMAPMSAQNYAFNQTWPDEGGGTYTFRSEYNRSSWFPYVGNLTHDWLGWFKTMRHFDADKDEFIWEFQIQGGFSSPEDVLIGEEIEGEVYVVTGDNVRHKVGKWSKPYQMATNVHFTMTDLSWGRFGATNLMPQNTTPGDDHVWMNVRYFPNDRAVKDGVKQIIIRKHSNYDTSISGNMNRITDWGWFQWEKDIDISAVSTASIALPPLSYEWENNGLIRFSAKDVPDKRGNANFHERYYNVRLQYSQNGSLYNTAVLKLPLEDFTVTNEHDGMMDIELVRDIRPANNEAMCPYFRSVYIASNYYVVIYPGGLPTMATPYSQTFPDEILRPFTSPKRAEAFFNKWKKQIIISWDRTMTAQASSSIPGRYRIQDCRTEGTWYVLRVADEQTWSNYTIVGSIPGDTAQLQVVDSVDIDYDKQYVYRVVFVPSPLAPYYPPENALHTGVLAAINPDISELFWDTAVGNSTLEMPIRLGQDMTYEDAIRLKWEYCMEPDGQYWTIESRLADGIDSWHVLDDGMMVDPTKSEAQFDTRGTVCDYYDFRVKTSWLGREFYSNIWTGHLPSGSYISEVSASTGTERDVVFVKWKVAKPDYNTDIYFKVYRRLIGDEEWTLLTDDIHGKEADYTYEDSRVMAGSYYEYTIEAYGAKCNEQIARSDAAITPGFSQAKGIITGHIAYGTGTAVQGARIKLIKASREDETDQPQFLSRRIEGEGKGLSWKGDSAKYTNVLNGQKELTIQLWAKPMIDNTRPAQAIVYLNNAIQLVAHKHDDYTCLAISDLSGTTNKIYYNLRFDDKDFTHITATYKNQWWKFYVGTDTLLCDSLHVTNNTWNVCGYTGGQPASYYLSIGGKKRYENEGFKGWVDDIRLWSKALTRKQIENNYTRILGGTEDGLILYWPLDEGIHIQDYAFDIAQKDGLFQLNHPEVGLNARTSDLTPQRLGLYGSTDESGNYIIQGIPFQQGGTNYELAPELGIHRFNPATRSMYVSPTSLTANNIDFEDVSSFPMRGYIYYAGTNIPAEDVQFYIDGDLVSANGEIKKTDANGFYEISVPIGEHYVEVRKDGHVFANNGRFPAEGLHNFIQAIQHDFADSTLVNFVGRVSGGAANDSLPVGFRLSNNNIGTASITLKLNNESFSFNCADDYISPATSERLFASDTSSIRSHAWTGIGAASKYIYITTDSVTGEFSALLPPLKYITKSIVVNTNGGVDFASLPEVDLTNPRQEWTDSIRAITEQGDTALFAYKYNTKMVKTYYAKPQVEVTQKKNPKSAFGLEQIVYVLDEAGHSDTIKHIWTNEDDNIHYRFTYPIYQMSDRYTYLVHGFEAYTNYDGATPVTDTVPLNDQELTISNEMSADQYVIYNVPSDTMQYKPGDIYELKHNTIILDQNGEAELEWIAGAPSITAPYTRHFSITMKRDDRTYVPFSLDAIVLGALTTGNNFVTKGPDNVQFVLRDPYGAHSKTTLKRAKINTRTHFETYERYGEHSLITNLIFGSKIETGVGLGLMVLSGYKAENQTDIGFEAKWEYTHRYDSTFTTTTIESISTSDGGYPYVGAQGDVFVGTATNILVGMCRKLYIKKDDITGEYSVSLEDALSVGDEISTLFAYTQQELEMVMIPKWKAMRKQYLTRVASEEAAYAMQNTTNHGMCVTWLQEDDPHYGDSATYRFIPPHDQPQDSERDSVELCNIQIQQWIKYLEENEKAKIETIKNGTYKNYSIDGGTTRTFTDKKDSIWIDQKKTVYKMGAVLGTKLGFKITSAGSFGIVANIKSDEGGGATTGDGHDKQNYTEWEYVLKDGNMDVDLSINMYDAENKTNSKIFSLFGGQSYNPYEGPDSTHYYKPDNVSLPLGNGTVQMEQPTMRIGVGNAAPARSLTLTDIPAGQSANAILYCTNNTNVPQTVAFNYNFMIVEKTDTTGLQILMDGVPVSGRSIRIPQGETVQKIITIRQTDQSILHHEGIRIRLASQYQARLINDEVTLNAHFTPSSSPVNLTIVNPVINTNPTTGEGKLQMKISGFDRTFKNLKNVGVQYRFAGQTQWTDIHTWETNPKDTIGAAHDLLPAEGDLKWIEDISNNIYYPEGNYELRAFTTTPYDGEMIQVFSDVIKVVKDLTKPRNLYTPAPANGILGYGEELSVEFNEDIIPGYVGEKNVIVTAKLNGQPIDHEVALQVSYAFQARTVNPIFLNGDFALEFWCKPRVYGSILHQGEGTSIFSLGMNQAGHATVNIAGTEYVSYETVPFEEWIYFAMSYDSRKMRFSLLAQYGTTSVMLFENEPISEQVVQAVDYFDDNHLYIGGFSGLIHDLALYNINRSVDEAAAKKYQSKDAYVYGLTNYWPMNEGHGTVAADMRHTHDFIVQGMWNIENDNYAIYIDGAGGARTSIRYIGTNAGDSYAIELWYASNAEPGEVMWETDGNKASNKLRLRYDDNKNLILDYGDKSQVVVSGDIPLGMNLFRHYALNVVRGQAASFYMDGKRTAVIAEKDVPHLEGDTLRIGRNGHVLFDELRIWKATLSEDRLLGSRFNRLDTADIYSRGLILYYPFEEESQMTVNNLAPNAQSGPLVFDHALPSEETPPLKKAVKETRLVASPVASERKVVINFGRAGISPRDIEGTTLNITLAEIHDLNGNTSDPIKWTAYVQQNTLKWKKDSVSILKQYEDPYTFQVDIENKSGQTEYYSLYNVPEWLTLVDSDMDDEVQPLKTKTLRFEVNPLVPVGNYDVNIGLQGNNQILEPLRIVMKVSGHKPDWNVDPMKYDHSMTIIGQVYLSGILMENSESMVAAFIDGECRGIAQPVKERGAAYVTLSIYGQDTQKKDGGKEISFRIWDASKGVAYIDALIAVDGHDTALVFHDGVLVGNFDNPAIWTKSNKVEQLFSVHENWNWITLGVEPETTYCDILFKPYLGWGILLKDRQTYIQSNGEQWLGPLVPVVNHMYKMKITRTPSTEYSDLNPQMSISGRRPDTDEMPVVIEQGWNWMPYTPLTTMTVGEALSALNPQKGDIIKSQTAVSIYSSNGWEGTLRALESGHGYLYFSQESVSKSFIYPASTGDKAGVMFRRVSNGQMVNDQMVNSFTPVNPTAYSSNMTMTIRLMDGESIVDTCEIAAFVENECRGAVRATDGLYYLVIAGDGAGQAMTIRTLIDGEIRTIDESIYFVSDEHIGTPWEPYVINLQQPEGIDPVIGNPSPVTRKLLRNGLLFIERNGRIYNAIGVEVK